MSAKPALGLYFTDDLIQLSKVSSDGKTVELAAQLNLTPGTIQNAEIKNEADFVASLNQLLQSAKPHSVSRNSPVVVGVNDNRVFLREFVVPKAAAKEVEEAINWQVRSLLPVLPAEVETDWKIIGRDANDNIEVLLIAIPKKIISSYLKNIQAVGLKIISIEPATFANIRLIHPDLLKSKNQLLIYFGENFAQFTYLTNSQPRFSDFLLDSEIEKKGSITTIANDYVAFANSKHNSRPIQEILLSGDPMKIQLATGTLKNQTLSLVIAKSLLTPSQVDGNLLHTVHGLSLKTMMGNHMVNLLPLDARLSEINRFYVSLYRNVLTLLITLTCFSLLGLGLFYQNLVTQETRLNQAKSSYLNSLSSQEKTQLVSQIKDFNSLVDQLILLQGSTGGEELILTDLSGSVAPGVTLTSLSYSPPKGAADSTWLITGVANSRPLVLDFYDHLLKTPRFANGQLYFGSLEKETSINFRIASLTK